MNYIEGMAGLQLVAEEEIGVHIREAVNEENRREDRSLEALRREQRELLR